MTAVAYDGRRQAWTDGGRVRSVRVRSVQQRSDAGDMRKVGSSGRWPAVVVALAAVLVLGGCSASPGAAAVAGDRTISQDDLERTQRDLGTVIESPGASAVLMAMVVAPLFIEAAADNGVGVSEEDARTLITQSAVAAGIDPVPELGDGAVEVIRFTLAKQEIDGLPDAADVIAGVDQQIVDLHVEVNPRYGDLNLETQRIEPLALPWIVAPTA